MFWISYVLFILVIYGHFIVIYLIDDGDDRESDILIGLVYLSMLIGMPLMTLYRGYLTNYSSIESDLLIMISILVSCGTISTWIVLNTDILDSKPNDTSNKQE